MLDSSKASEFADIYVEIHLAESYIDDTFLRFDSETNEIDEDAAEDALFDDYFSGRYADWELRETQQQKAIQEAKHYGEEITRESNSRSELIERHLFLFERRNQ